MAGYDYQQSSGHDGGDEHRRQCPECDLGALEELECSAEGLKARAAYMDKPAKDLTENRKKFDGARKAYTDARNEATPTVEDIRLQLEHVLEQLTCLLDKGVIACLEDAYADAYEKLRKCGGEVGCCAEEDCKFNSSVSDDTSDEDLHARIAEYQRRVAESEQCFKTLIDEPQELKNRVTNLKKEAAELATAVGADPKKTDPKRTYARARVAWQQWKDIWGGFTDSNAYYDCLCQALVCAIKGHEALALLTAALKFRGCKSEKDKERCKWLEKNFVEEILAICLKRWNEGKESYGSTSPPRRY